MKIKGIWKIFFVGFIIGAILGLTSSCFGGKDLKYKDVILNVDKSVSNSYVNKTYNDIKKAALQKEKFIEKQIEVSKLAYNEIKKIAIEKNKKDYNEMVKKYNLDIERIEKDFFDIMRNTINNMMDLKVKNIFYVDKNNIVVEYETKTVNVYNIEKYIEDEELQAYAGSKFVLLSPRLQQIEQDETKMADFVYELLEKHAQDVMDKLVERFKSKNDYLTVEAYAKLSYKNNKWQFNDILEKKSANKLNVLVKNDSDISEENIKNIKNEILELVNKADLKNEELKEELNKLKDSKDIIKGFNLITKNFMFDKNLQELKGIYILSKDTVVVNLGVDLEKFFNYFINEIKTQDKEEKLSEYKKEINNIRKTIKGLSFDSIIKLVKKEGKWEIYINEELKQIIEKTMKDYEKRL